MTPSNAVRVSAAAAVGAAVLGLLAVPVRAQQDPSAPVSQADSASEAREEPAASVEVPATLRVLVFAESVPHAGASVRVGDQTVLTDEHGVAMLELPAGMHDLHVELQLAGEDGASSTVTGVRQVGLIAGETSEVIANADGPDAPLDFDVEGPSEAEVEASEVQASVATVYGTLRGRARLIEDSTPVVGGRVFVRGLDVDAATDAEGRFELRVPVGTHAVSVIHPNFSTLTRGELTVAENEVTEVELVLTPAAVRMDDFVVTAPHIEGGLASLVSERRETTAVADVVGSEQMSKSGASDAAGALSRVTGLTVVDGKYVFVRGMGLRYSSTLLNGFSVPSPEPTLRVIPLDMFPSGVLEGLVVQKTFSPERPAEFGGGAVMIRTRSYPEEWEARLSIGTGGNTQTTGRKRIAYQGGNTDFLGIDDGTRALSPELRRASEQGKVAEGNRFTEGLSSEELEQLGESLPNIWNIRSRTVPANGSFSASLGNSFSLGRAEWGFMLSPFYKNEYWAVESDVRTVKVSGDRVEPKDTYRFEELQQTVSLGGIFATGVELNGHKVEANTMLLRTSDDLTLLGSGRSEDYGPMQLGRMRWQERQLFSQQVLGHHPFDEEEKWAFDWRYAYSQATNDEPDQRDFAYDRVGGEGVLRNCQRPFCLGRFFGEMEESMHEAAVDLTMPLPLWRNLSGKLKVGAGVSRRDRDNFVRRYRWARGNSSGLVLDSALTSQDLESIYQPNNTGGDGFQFTETTLPSENYTAQHEIESGYAMAEIPLGGSLDWMVGARVEHSLQHAVATRPFVDEGEDVVSTIDKVDVLPATTLTWRMVEDHQLRFGYGRTVNRPLLREMVDAPFIEPRRGWTYRGNPDLERALLDNFDVRWEWYFSGDESLSIAGFGKRFQDPIEAVQTAGADLQVIPQNADLARNYGAEIEARKRLGFSDDGPGNDFYLAGNVALIYSRVEFSEENRGVQTDASRALEGQAPYMINAQAGYDTLADGDYGLSLALLYNVVGPSIFVVGQQGIPNGVQQPVHRVDLVYLQSLGEHVQLSFKAENLLDWVVVATQGDVEVQRYRRGRYFSLSLRVNL